MADAEKSGTSGGEEDSAEIEELEDVAMSEDVKATEMATKMMKNPQIVAALQSKLSSIIGTPSDYISNLPKSVKRRIKSLKKLQFEATKSEAMFFQEVYALECKYLKLYQPLFEKRFQITSGVYEPNDDESDWPSDEEKEFDDLAGDANEKLKIEDSQPLKTAAEEIKVKSVVNEDCAGIPEFWLTIFKNVETLAEMVQKHDEPVLKHLIDLKVKISESNPMGFCLEFHFEANEYLNNSVLTKEYEMKCSPDDSDPFSFDGPEIVRCKGCEIDWKKGKNVTVKTIKKKQKHKSKGSLRTITKTIDVDSFFNFFNPPTIPEDDDEVDEDMQTLLATDFEIGHYIRERIVPRAVLYFTGEALEDEMEDEDEGEEEDESEEDDYNSMYNELDDPDFDPRQVVG